MQIVIIEDEMHNARMLAGMLAKVRPQWILLETIASVKRSVEWFSENSMPDLVFMDIQLADGLCFSIFDQVEIECPVIFTTAYDNYAIQAFKVNSVDYLLKPIKESELEFALEKFEQIFANSKVEKKSDYSEIFNAIRNGEKKYRKRFLIQGNKTYHKINSEDIAYFYSVNKITSAVTFNNQEHIVDFTLENLEEELEPDCFFRANRQYIIHVNSISKIEDYFDGKLIVKIKPPSTEPITISRLKATAFKKWLGK